jgi:hypothetical protein
MGSSRDIKVVYGRINDKTRVIAHAQEECGVARDCAAEKKVREARQLAEQRSERRLQTIDFHKPRFNMIFI